MKTKPYQGLSHRGIAALLAADRNRIEGNHSLHVRGRRADTDKQGSRESNYYSTIRTYFYFGNAIVREWRMYSYSSGEVKKLYAFNPKWIGYSVSTTRALNQYALYFDNNGYERVDWAENTI